MQAEQLKGHLDALLLAAVAGGAEYGYAIREQLHADTGGRLDLPTGTIYPALHRLERAGLMTAEWVTVGPRRRRRCYRLTEAGREALAGHRTAWREFASSVSIVLGMEAPWPATA